MLNNLATVAWDLGEWPESERLLRRAIAIREKAIGRDHPLTLLTLGNLAEVELDRGEYQAADRIANDAVERLRAQDAQHPRLDGLLPSLARTHVALGRYDEAFAILEEVLERREAARGRDSVVLLDVILQIGDVELRRGHSSQGRASYARALAIVEKALGAEHLRVVAPLLGLARCDLAESQPKAAEEKLSRALAVALRGDPQSTVLPEVKIVLAQALARRDPRRARALAEDAARGTPTSRVAVEIDRFLHRSRAAQSLAVTPRQRPRVRRDGCVTAWSAIRHRGSPDRHARTRD